MSALLIVRLIDGAETFSASPICLYDIPRKAAAAFINLAMLSRSEIIILKPFPLFLVRH